MDKENKERKVFLDDLPRKKGVGRNKDKQVVDWKNSIGYKVKGIYESLEFEVEIMDYNSKTGYLDIKYLNKEPFKIFTGSFQQCLLGKLLNKYTNEFKVEIGKTYKDEKRNITIINREYRVKMYKSNWKINQKWYKYQCNTCGWTEGWIVESELLRGTGCSCCCNRTAVEGINSVVDTDPWMIQYFVEGYQEAKLYTAQSNQKIFPICQDCKKTKSKAISICQIYKTHSIGCSCSDGQSYPFKMMFNVLEQLNINFETEYSPDWIKPKRFDFYFEINNNNIIHKYIIEMDGSLGHGSKNKISNQSAEDSQEIDDKKDRLANKHDIKVIRIDAKVSELEYIKNNIYIKLINILNLNNINWSKAEDFALSNLVKKACDYKKDNPNMTNLDISKIMNINRRTVLEYLKKGTKLGWCDYNPKEESRKASSKAGKMSGKPVAIFKDGIKLSEFGSCAELERQSEERFGIKLISSCISAVCTGRKNMYKNYTFKYIEN